MVVLGEVALFHERGTPVHLPTPRENLPEPEEREFSIDNLLVWAHFIIVMVRWTGLAPWDLEFPFPGSLTSARERERERGGGVGAMFLVPVECSGFKV